MPSHDTNREAWLTAALPHLARRFPVLVDIDDDVRVSCGYGPRASRRVRLVSVEWDTSGVRQVYVSPLLDSAPEVLAVLAYGVTSSRAVRRSLGFTGACGDSDPVVPSPELCESLEALAAMLDAYPHAHTDPSATASRVQSTRMLKAECEPCGYIVRLSRTQLERGAPLCGVCARRMTV